MPLAETEREFIARAAGGLGLSLAAFLREAALMAAEKALNATRDAD